MNYQTKYGIIFALSGSLLSTSAFSFGEDVKKQWITAGQNISNTRSTDKSGITSKNVAQLVKKWEYTTFGDVSATPVSDGDTVYVVDWGGWIHAINAKTGVAKWSENLSAVTGLDSVMSRTSPAITGNKLVLGLMRSSGPNIAEVVVLDKNDGHLIWKKQVEANHFAAAFTQSPIVYDGKIFMGVTSNEEALAAFIPNYKCCSFRGSMLALNLANGDIIWQRYVVPPGYSGGAVWGSTAAIDPKRRSLYFTTGNNYSIPESVNTCITNAGSDNEAAKKCLAKDNYFDSIVSVNINTGKVNWAFTPLVSDTWTVACIFELPTCPANSGPDADFGQGPGLFEAKVNGKKMDLIGAGQKSGVYWALNRDTGKLIWNTQVGPGGTTGGLQWGSAVQDGIVYTALANSLHLPYTLPDSTQSTGGGFAALKGNTGQKLWQIADPVSADAIDYAPVSVANDVMFACSMDTAEGPMYAINAKTGKILWTYNSGASCNSGAAIVGDMVFWGSGYSNFGFGTPNNKVFAFGLPAKKGNGNPH